jgi:hypothetical protein
MYIDGEPNNKISNENLVDELENKVREKIAKSKVEIIARS